MFFTLHFRCTTLLAIQVRAKHDSVQLRGKMGSSLGDMKEIMFAIQLEWSIKISFNLPVMVRIDNVGAIFVAGDITASSHSKHVNIRYKHVNGYEEVSIINIVFVKSANMSATFSWWTEWWAPWISEKLEWEPRFGNI